MSFKEAIQEAVSAIPECLAAGYVDLSTGMLLDVKTVDSHPDEVLDMFTIEARFAEFAQRQVE